MNQKFFLFLAGLLLILQACEKTEYVKPDPQLEITVMGDNVVLIEGATVTLYNTKEDWTQNANAVQSLQTDSKGQVLFEDLKEQKYYFLVEKDDMNNLADIAATAEPLKVGQLSQLLVKIMENPL
ncbi:MAG TPA: SpaA isopeptide-forming pilin-related protein [Draconibacterium sp.]|mgnify:CR=1 FL=1|nr:SpaA isopeptide-forming pilin-related protein [Draconibacterium sp.]